MSELSGDKDFKLSRIQAQGWNAGQQLTADDADAASESNMEKLNPYSDASERERWSQGFLKAVEKNATRSKKNPVWTKT